MPTGIFKHKPMTKEQKGKISQTLKTRGIKPPVFKGMKFTEKHKQNISNSHKGSKQSIETRIKKSESLKGNKSPNWKGGINPIDDTIRKSVEYGLWREAVFKRDNFVCQKTGISGGELVAHHIMNFAQHDELRFAIDNGITLSKIAHQDFHKIYGIKNNTKEQLIEFLIKK